MSGLDVYGLRASVAGDWPDVVDQLLLDFAWFRAEVAVGADVRVEAQRRPRTSTPSARWRRRS